MKQLDADIKNKFEVDKIYYEEATQRGINLSYSFYVTLGLYIAIIGGYLSLNGNHEKYANFIGLIFFLLLFPLAKISRLQEDNNDVHKKFKENHKSDIIFKGTGIRGIGDFFHYCILFGITSFFLLRPFKTQIPPALFVGLFALIFVFLVIVIYYVFARGDFLLEETRLLKNIIFEISKGKIGQYLFLGLLIIISLAYGLSTLWYLLNY